MSSRASGDRPPAGGEDADVSRARYGLFVGVVLGMFLVTFVVAASALPRLDDPGPLLSGSGVIAAVCGVGLLLADVVLPVPSSVVMIAHGVLFGALAGAALSLIGGVGAAWVGYGLGRCAGPPVLRRVCSAAEQARAARFVDRWGVLAVVVTRPVPLLAETVAVMAGVQTLGWLTTAIAAVGGVCPPRRSTPPQGALGWSGEIGLAAFGLVLLVAALMWLFGRVRPAAGGGLP